RRSHRGRRELDRRALHRCAPPRVPRSSVGPSGGPCAVRRRRRPGDLVGSVPLLVLPATVWGVRAAGRVRAAARPGRRARGATCRQWATHQTGTSPAQASAQSTISGAAIGTLLGAAAGALVGAAAGRPGTGAAVGAGVGLVGGTAVGASNAGPTYGSLQRRYD